MIAACLLLALLPVPETARLHAVRLRPGQDARAEIVRLTNERGIRAGAVVTAVGSLRSAVLRFAARDGGTTVEGPLEVVSLVGTVGEGGRVHLHASVSDGSGRTVGGHLMDGSRVHTTLELVIAELPGTVFAREKDDETGYEELAVKPLPVP